MIVRNQLQTGHYLSQVLPLLKGGVAGKVLAMLKLGGGGIKSVDVVLTSIHERFYPVLNKGGFRTAIFPIFPFSPIFNTVT